MAVWSEPMTIADGWLAEWTPDYGLDRQYSPRAHALFVDLEAMAGMQLVTGSKAPPGLAAATPPGQLVLALGVAAIIT